jgi:tryptophan-rich sensory protein
MDPMQDQDALGAAVFLAMVLIVPVWRIVRRTGRHPALALLIFFPGIGIILVAFILAFGRWPALEGKAARVEN